MISSTENTDTGFEPPSKGLGSRCNSTPGAEVRAESEKQRPGAAREPQIVEALAPETARKATISWQ